MPYRRAEADERSQSRWAIASVRTPIAENVQTDIKQSTTQTPRSLMNASGVRDRVSKVASARRQEPETCKT